MKTVSLQWTPSTSPGVDSQRVNIHNIETLEVYGEDVVGPLVSVFNAPVPEGVTVRGIVATIRGDEEAIATSEALDVGYDPLTPATGLSLSILEAVPQRR